MQKKYSQSHNYLAELGVERSNIWPIKYKNKFGEMFLTVNEAAKVTLGTPNTYACYFQNW